MHWEEDMAPASGLAANETIMTTTEQVASARSLDEDVLRPPAESQVRLQFTLEDGTTLPLPDELIGIVVHTLETVRSGGTITIGSIPEELTTTAAADLLGISRTTLMKRIRQGEVPSHKVGTHTRLKSADILAIREEQRRSRREAAHELLDLGDELGMHN